MKAGSIAILAALAGCRAERVADSCSASVDEDVRTRVRVTWEAPVAGTSEVTYGDGMVTPATEGEAGLQEAVLLGIPPLTDVAFRAVTETERGRYVCEGRIRTGGAPVGLPDLFVSGWDEALDPGSPYLVGLLQQQSNTLVVIDREGRYLWWHVHESARMGVDAKIEAGADQVLFNTFEEGTGLGLIARVGLTGGTGPDLTTTLAHHVFTRTPDGFAYLRAEIRTLPDPESGDPVDVVGDTIVEIDEAGVERVVWSTFDSVPVEILPPPGGLYGPDLVDWTHGNAIDYRDGAYLYSSAHLRRMFEVSREGEVLRTFGNGGEYPVEPPTDFVINPHDAHWTEAGTLLMTGTNEFTGHGGAVEYRVEESPRRLVKIWSHGFEDGLTIHYLGQARRLRNGNTLVNFGSAGVVRTVTPAGEVAWELETGLGASFGQVMLFGGLYSAAPDGD